MSQSLKTGLRVINDDRAFLFRLDGMKKRFSSPFVLRVNDCIGGLRIRCNATDGISVGDGQHYAVRIPSDLEAIGTASPCGNINLERSISLEGIKRHGDFNILACEVWGAFDQYINMSTQ